jgi:alpha-mannosidase
MKKIILSLAVMAVAVTGAQAQQKYFVDGYHGGVYGHYPLMTYTQFLVDQLEQNPNWFIGLEIEPETWDTVQVKTPEAYLAFRQKMGTDQVEYTNPSYAQSYLYCINGESIIRQFHYGIRKIRQHFPDVLISTYAVEEPCFTSCIPTVLSQFGFCHAVLKCPNTCWGGYSAPYGGELVNLIGPDGTRMLSVPRYGCEKLEEKSVWQTTAWGNQPKYFNACFDYGISNPVGMTYQDAGWTGGPWIGRDDRSLHGTKYTRWTKYIEEQSVGSTTDDYKFSQEDVRPGLMWGSQVLQRLAQQCRREEYYIPQAEKMAAMAKMETGFVMDQAAVDEAWRTLLLSQHHDCWIVPYNHLNSRGTWADNVKLWTEASHRISDGVIDNALASYNAHGNPALKVFNTSGHARKEVVTAALADGRVIDMEVEVPAFGYTVIPADQLKEAQDTKSIKVKGNSFTMENDVVRITFDLTKGATVKSLKMKDSGYEYVDRKSPYAVGELRGFFDETKNFVSSKEQKASVQVLKDNAMEKTVKITGAIGTTAFSKTVTLRKGSPLIDCKLCIDWKENHRIGDFTRSEKKAKNDKRTTFYDTRYALSLMLPTSMKAPKLYKSAPFDVCESQLKSTFYNDWDSIKHNVIEQWIDLHSAQDGHSLALLTDHTTSYSYATDYPLALTAQYSGPGLWGRDYKIDGKTEFRYALIPHDGEWDKAEISRQNAAWNEPLITVNSYTEASSEVKKSLLDLGNSGYELTSVTTDGDSYLVRLFNAEGDGTAQTVSVAAEVTAAAQVDLLGNKVDDINVTRSNGNSQLSVSMPRFGVKTYRLNIK